MRSGQDRSYKTRLARQRTLFRTGKSGETLRGKARHAADALSNIHIAREESSGAKSRARSYISFILRNRGGVSK
jgi:hypothetical protein